MVVNYSDKVLKIIELFKGSITGISSNPHLILKEVMGVGNRFYFIHNHPSGVLIPSKEDIQFTSSLDMLSTNMKIEFVDHLIVNDRSFISIREYLKEKIELNINELHI